MKKTTCFYRSLILGGLFTLTVLCGNPLYAQFGDNLGKHKADRALDMNAKNLTNVALLKYKTLDVANLATGGDIGLPAATVDLYTAFQVTQSTAGQALTLPSPTTPFAGQTAYVKNTGTASFTLYGTTVAAGAAIGLNYNGTAWQVAGSGSSPVTVVNSTNLFSTGLTSTGFAVTTSSNSIFLGVRAGSTAIGSSNSNFIGISAGEDALNTTFSNFLGHSAGYNSPNASYSNFIGYRAGANTTNAVNSIFIGQEAGASDNVNNSVNGLSSILIGSYTKTGGFPNSILLGSGVNGTPIANTKSNQFMLAPSVTEMRLRGIDYSLPSAQGAASTVLTNDGSGTLSWAAPSSSWSLTGNASTNPATNFIGTTDDKDLVFKRNGIQVGWLSSDDTPHDGGPSTGTGNTAFGFEALLGNTGLDNVAIGATVLRHNTTGFNNTSIGYWSLVENTTGNNNTAIGSSSLQKSINTNNNTAVGLSSFQSLITGNSNVSVGDNAGATISTSSVLTSISNSVLLGSNTKALADGDANEIVIGYNATGLGSNSMQLGNSSVTKYGFRGVGYTFPAVAGTSGQVLTASDASGTLGWTTPTATALGGDVSGTLASATVNKLKNASLTFTGLASNNLLQYNGSAWVNAAPSTLGTIGLLTGTTGTDVNVSGSPATLGSSITLNIPDAGTGVRGLITTGAQTLEGSKSITATADPLLLTGGVGRQTAAIAYSGLVIDNATGAIRKAPVVNTLSDVKDYDTSNPSALTPAMDESWIVKATGAGLWAGHDNQIATWDGSGWLFYTPVVDDRTSVLLGDEAGKVFAWSGTAWVQMQIASSTALSDITAAVAAHTIDNKNFAQTWNWSTLAGANALTLGSNSTAAASNAQTLLNVSMSGANATASQITYAAKINNTHTGTSAGNVGLSVSASGAVSNFAIVVPSGNVGVGTVTPTSTLHVTGSVAQSIATISAATTLGATHSTVLCNAATAGFTVTLPAANSCTGRIYRIIKSDVGSNVITLSPAITIPGSASTITTCNVPGAVLLIQSDGTNWVKIN